MKEKLTDRFQLRQLLVVTLITSIWIHITEVLRAVLVAFPLMESFFNGIIEIGPMEPLNIFVWVLWDMLLTFVLVFITYLVMKEFGKGLKSILISATVTTFATLGIYWIAAANTGLGTWATAFTIIPIVVIEMTIGAWIVQKLYEKNIGRSA